jgi:hypothetical protein
MDAVQASTSSDALKMKKYVRSRKVYVKTVGPKDIVAYFN